MDDNSFWESSAYDSANDETDNDTEFSGSTPPHVHSDTDESRDYDQMPPTKKMKLRVMKATVLMLVVVAVKEAREVVAVMIEKVVVVKEVEEIVAVKEVAAVEEDMAVEEDAAVEEVVGLAVKWVAAVKVIRAIMMVTVKLAPSLTMQYP